MPLQRLNTGSAPNDGTGNNLRDGGNIINANFDALDAARQAMANSIQLPTAVAVTRVDGSYIDKSTGAAVVSTGFSYATAPLTGTETTIYVTTFTTGTVIPVVFLDATGVVISSSGAIGTNYVDAPFVVPAGARSVAINLRADGSHSVIGLKTPQVTPNIAARLATAESSVTDAKSSANKSATSLSVPTALTMTRVDGSYIDKSTGAAVVSTGFSYATAPLAGYEGTIYVTTYTTGVVIPVVFLDAAGAVISSAGVITANYVDEPFAVPASARSVALNLRADSSHSVIAAKTPQVAPSVGARLAVAETKLSGFDTRIGAVETSSAATSASVSTPTANVIARTDGSYIHATTGAAVVSTGFSYATAPLTGAEGKIYVTTFTVGTVIPVVFLNAAGAVISSAGVINTNYTDEPFTVPATARSVAINLRADSVHSVIALKTMQVTPNIGARLVALEGATTPSAWKGKSMATFGDSLTGQGRWQPLVIAAHGVVLTNCGVGGSKIAKPDASSTSVSMCDDARISAIPAASDLLLFEGGTNDWAQSVPLGDFSSTADTEFYGALHITIGKLLTLLPAKRIFVITSPYGERITLPGGWANGWTNTLGLTIRDYAKAMRTVAEYYGMPVIDWSRECGWSHANVAQFLDNDGAYFHPSSAVGAPRLAGIVNGRLWDVQS